MTEEMPRIQDAPARLVEGVREQVIRRMAHLLELAYMACDRKRFDRCIKLCEQILLIDPHYIVARELKEDCEKARHSDGYLGTLAWKVGECKKLTDDDEAAAIPWSQTVRFPDLDEWADISRRASEFVIRVEGEVEEDQDNLAIERKLNTMKMDLAFENTKLEDILAFIRDFSGVNLLLDGELFNQVDPDRLMSFRVDGLVLKHVLRLLASDLGLDYVVTDERVVLLTAPYRVPLLNRRN